MLKEEILKTCQIFLDFIKFADRADWVNSVKRSNQTKVFNVIQHDGQMNVQSIASNQAFAGKAKSFAEGYTKNTKNAIK